MNARPAPPFDDAPDDVDRLFARLEPVRAPADLTARVLANTVARGEPATIVLWPWLVATLGALAALVAAGYLVGAQLATSEGLALVEAVFGDASLLTGAPGDVLAAIAQLMPSGLVVLTLGSAALVVWSAGHLVSVRPRPRTRAGA
jgi:hypothetical protein